MFGLGGLGLLAVGLGWWLHPAVGIAVLGAGLFYLGVFDPGV